MKRISLVFLSAVSATAIFAGCGERLTEELNNTASDFISSSLNGTVCDVVNKALEVGQEAGPVEGEVGGQLSEMAQELYAAAAEKLAVEGLPGVENPAGVAEYFELIGSGYANADAGPESVGEVSQRIKELYDSNYGDIERTIVTCFNETQ